MRSCEALRKLSRSILLTVTSGAAVLAHSLRDGGSKKKLACLITLDTLSADSISELKVAIGLPLGLATTCIDAYNRTFTTMSFPSRVWAIPSLPIFT